MARKDVLGLSGMLAGGAKPADKPASLVPKLAPGATPGSSARGSAFDYGAIAGVRNSLLEANNRSVQEIQSALIDDFGPNDRLAISEESVAELARSIKEHGQHVPAMLRPNPDAQGRFLVIAGRRRIAACRLAGVPVKALVRDLDNDQAIIMRGQENALRLDPSFIEKVNFLRDLLAEGYEPEIVQEAIAVERTTFSRMMTIASVLPEALIRWVGPAPATGRRRWLEVSDMWKAGERDLEALLASIEVPEEAGSDDRVQLLIDALQATPIAPAAVLSDEGTLPPSDAEGSGVDAAAATSPAFAYKAPIMLRGKRIGMVQRKGKAATLKILPSAGEGFAQWLAENVDTVLGKAHEQWMRDVRSGK